MARAQSLQAGQTRNSPTLVFSSMANVIKDFENMARIRYYASLAVLREIALRRVLIQYFRIPPRVWQKI